MITGKRKKEFTAVLERYGGIISKVCYFYAEDGDMFLDLRQEALLNLWKGFDSWSGESAISTWIYRITLNSCVSFFRRNRRHKSTLKIEDIPPIISSDIDKATLLRELYSLISRLDKTEMALILLWLDEYSYDSISDITGLPRNTVATRLRRIKKKLVEFSKE